MADFESLLWLFSSFLSLSALLAAMWCLCLYVVVCGNFVSGCSHSIFLHFKSSFILDHTGEGWKEEPPDQVTFAASLTSNNTSSKAFILHTDV